MSLRVLVTGSTSGIGAGIAAHLRGLGWQVLTHGTAPGKADVRADLYGDVQRDADAIVAAAVTRLGGIDALVNNAGIWPPGRLTELTDDDVAETVRVNLLGVAAMTRAVSDVLSDGGAICNVSSIEAFAAPHAHSHYVASKAGVLGHTRAAAVELGARAIRINAVAPGLIERPGITEQWPDGVGRWLSASPIARLGTPDDVAKAVAFLIGPDSTWISGACLVVDGAMSARAPW